MSESSLRSRDTRRPLADWVASSIESGTSHEDVSHGSFPRVNSSNASIAADLDAGFVENGASHLETARRTWKKNERLVYATNFVHMAMMTMCMGGIWEIFLYSLSQDTVVLAGKTPVTIGEGAALQPPQHLSTFDTFEMTFDIRPSKHIAQTKNASCNYTYTCATSVLHVTTGLGNGDCCRIGDRIPAIFFHNGTAKLLLAMDIKGYNHSNDDVWAYDQHQLCFANQDLAVEEWSSIKVKEYESSQAKGQGKGGLALFINGQKACEISRAKRGLLPSFRDAFVYFGALQEPLFKDRHTSANAELRNVKYGKPASNTFVGLAMSLQGICSVVVMYPIGWLGDRMNRYHLVRWNIFVAVAAGGSLATAVLLQSSYSVTLIFVGIIVWSAYQQAISALIYAILADNVLAGERARASRNYKTLTALAMSMGPAIQLLVLGLAGSREAWSPAMFRLLLLPGWLLLPVVGLAVLSMTPVGKHRSELPSADEMPRSQGAASLRLSAEWLDQLVFRSVKRRYVVAGSAQAFFMGTLMANGMTVKYFSLYFTEILKFSPEQLCLLNAVCRLWIAVFVQLTSPFSARMGRANLCIFLHFGSAVFTAGIYGLGLFQPGIWAACFCYLMRFAFLHARDPLLYSMTMDVVPESQRSRWAALNSLRTLSFSASALIGGFLSDNFGYQFSFQVTVYALLVCTVLFLPAWLFFPKSEGGSPTCE